MRHQHQQTIRQQSDQHPLSSATGTNSDQPATIVVETLEHRRFAEFCDACKRYRYIGLCYGSPGVGKTLSARHYSRWDYLEEIDPYAVSNEALGSLMGIRTMFYTTPVVNNPGQISSDIDRLRFRLQSLAREPLRRKATPNCDRHRSRP